MRGRVIGNISNLYKVKTDKEVYLCCARGKLKQENNKLLVGDIVEIDQEQKIIDKIYPRKNELIRPPISNVDQAIIVVSVMKPKLDLYLLDRLISIISYHDVEIIICFTKLDLLENKSDLKEIMDYYQKIGYSVTNNNDIDKLKELLKNKVTVVAGQSGVGKSSLLNKLNPEFNLITDEISRSLRRGKNTTKHVELLEIESGLVADTPGFSMASLEQMSKEEIRDSFKEFDLYKDDCQYRDCYHINENNCAVKQADILESRYQNYCKFIKEKDE